MSGPPVGALRESVRRAVAATSLRAVADQVGITHRGLALFLEGSKPRPGTVRKLTAWYLTRPRDVEEVTTDLAEAAMAVLLAEVPASTIDRAVRDVAACVRQICEQAGAPPPSWIGAVLARRR
jgi:hypothetical protein